MTITTKLLKPFLLKLIERNKREKKNQKGLYVNVCFNLKKKSISTILYCWVDVT